MSGVLAILPRGEAIRNFVYSSALDRVGGEVPLAVASVIPNHEIRTLLTERYGPIEELCDHGSRWLSGAVRDTLDVAHGRWLWSEAAQERWRRRDSEADVGGGRWKNTIKRAIARPAARPRGLSALDSVYESLASKLDIDEADTAILDRHQPSLVFNGSHVHAAVATPLLLAARQRRVATIAFLFSWDNLTSQGRVIPRYNGFLVWTDRIRDDLLRMYPSVDPSCISVTGTPQFDAHFDRSIEWSRDRYADLIGADPERPIILYSTGMPNHMPGEPWLVE